MPDFIRCPTCRGCKNVRGFGHMLKKCSECAGIGYCAPKQAQETAPLIKEIADRIENQISSLLPANPDTHVITKKRGRRPKLAVAT